MFGEEIEGRYLVGYKKEDEEEPETDDRDDHVSFKEACSHLLFP